MAKEKIQKSMGVFASIFAHKGHISKEEAQEMSGLDKKHFDEVYEKAGKIVKKLEDKENPKIEKWMAHLAEEIDEYMKWFV